MAKELERSAYIYERLCEVIPGGVNSPVRAAHEVQHTPLVVDRAQKDQVFDMDGNAYIDFCGSWGALIHGHAHPAIIKACYKRMCKGTTFGITSGIEEKLARKIVELIDSIEKIRFVSSGTEATMSAIRLARGFTKRDKLVKFAGNYHGHADLLLVQAGSGVFSLAASSSAGIPQGVIQDTICLPYNDVEACRRFLCDPANQSKIAAVIVEPIAGNMGVVPASQPFIQMLREETSRMGALLIFDEVITGFRVSLKGAQELYAVRPDLTCLGKIVGGGFPAAAFGGRKEIMDLLAPLGPVYQAGTLSGNPVAMEAGLQSICLLEQPDMYAQLQSKTDLITAPVKAALEKKQAKACLQQVGSMFTLFFGKTSVTNMQDAKELDLPMYSRFFKHMFDLGIYIPPSQHEAWFVSSAHETHNLKKTRDAILEFIYAYL